MKKWLYFILIYWNCSVFGQDTVDTTITFNTFSFEENNAVTSVNRFVLDSVLPLLPKNATVADVLQKYSDISIKSYSNSGLASVSLRGTGASHTAVFFNGMLLNSPTNGQLDFNILPTSFFKSAAIIYGSASLNNGAGGIGGAIELSDASDKTKSIEIEQGIGSFQTVATNTDIVLGKNNFRSQTTVYYTNSANRFLYYIPDENNQFKPFFAQNSAYLKQGIKQRFDLNLKNKWQFFYDGWYLYNYRELVPPLNTVSDESQIDKWLLSMVGMKGTFEKVILSQKVLFQNQFLEYNNPSAAINSVHKVNSLQNKINAVYFVNDKLRLEADANQFLYRINSSEIAAIDKMVLLDNKLQAEYKVKNWQFDVLNRVVWRNKLYAFQPLLGLSRFFKGKRFYVKMNASKNIHLPTINDLYWNPGGNPLLQPEIAYSVELTVGGTIIKNKKWESNLSASLYKGYVENWILWHPVGSYWQADNIKHVSNQGVELLLKNKFKFNKNNNLTVRINYSYNEVKNDVSLIGNENIIGKQLIYVPFHTGAVNCIWSIKNTQLSYNLKYTGLRYITTDNSWYLPANYISDISISKKIMITKKINTLIGGSVNNLFNQPYQLVANRSMPARNYFITLKLEYY